MGGGHLSLEAESGPAARIVTHKHREPRDTDIIISQFHKFSSNSLLVNPANFHQMTSESFNDKEASKCKSEKV